jgi:Flp pilus assembly protein TadB
VGAAGGDAGEAGRTAYSWPVFGRNRTLNEQQAETIARAEREGAKNRPTPKRREQEAARKRPLVVADRKAAKRDEQLKRREASARMRQAMVTGDEAHLPARDKGPERRFIRDYVDARWNIGEFMLPVMIVVLALSFVRQSWALMIVFIAVYGILLVAVVDAVLMWRRLKKRLVAKFGEDRLPRGGAMYAVMRAFQMRRSRMPKPQVERGQQPS